MTFKRTTKIGLLAPLTCVALAGCGASASFSVYGGGATLNDPNTVVTSALASIGESASVNCPSDIPAKVGHVFTCTLTNADGTVLHGQVTETSINGSTVKVNVHVTH
jgi:Domain of unknown function (DUF4333)